jgi:His-Xaa-Ser system protein HxsD
MKERMEILPNGSIHLPIDKTLYDSETVLKTSHKFTDRCYIDINIRDDDIVLSFEVRDEIKTALGLIVNDFLNELIDQRVRAIVEKECCQIRDQIVRKAFSPIDSKGK